MKKDYSKQLNEFNKYLKSFPEIKKIKYTGSTATKSWDEYSDLDIDIYVNKKDFPKITGKIPKILSWWGEIKLMCKYPDVNEFSAYVGKDFLKVEIDIIVLGEEEHNKKKTKQQIEDTSVFLRDWTIYLSRHYTRGQKISAYYETLSLGRDIIKYFSEAKGLPYFELIRNSEKLLSKKEKIFFDNLFLRKCSKKELIRFILNIWRFLEYIDNVWEKRNKTKLNLKIKKKETLKMVLDTIK